MPVIASNDTHIPEILKSTKYRIDPDGTCWLIDSTKKTWRRWDRLRRNGYRSCSFRDKEVFAHRLVYAKYKGDISSNLTINHIDGNTSNNKPSNLELVSQGENILHSYAKLNRKPVRGHAKINFSTAKMIREQRRLGATYLELTQMFDLSKSTISYVVNKRTWA